MIKICENADSAQQGVGLYSFCARAAIFLVIADRISAITVSFDNSSPSMVSGITFRSLQACATLALLFS